MADAKAKTINLLLYEGNLGGVISIEDSSWNSGELYSAPRDSVDELLDTDACKKYGVYLLISQEMVYVGQASDLARRIGQHKVGKDWWESVVILTTKDDSLNHSDIPFNAKIEGKSDIKNYTNYLTQNAGPFIMRWIIEGAQKAIADDFHFDKPQVVTDAIEKYRQDNDWLGEFISECCEIDSTYKQKSGEFYQAYRSYCDSTGEFTRSTADFYSALESAGFEKKKVTSGSFIHGVRLKIEQVL